MKNILTIATLLLTACSPDKADNDVARSQSTNNNGATTTKTQTTKDDLIGEWGIYDTFDGSTVTSCNACPTITFHESRTATINFPGGTTETIRWKREKQILTIENVTASNKDREFDNGKYTLTFDKEGRLEIKEMSTSYTYGLGRHDSNWR